MLPLEMFYCEPVDEVTPTPSFLVERTLRQQRPQTKRWRPLM